MPPVARAETNGLFPHRVLYREHPSLSVDQPNRPSWRAKMNAQPAFGKPPARQARNIQHRTHNSAKECLRFVTDVLDNSRSPSAIEPVCLTSTAALRESIHQRSRSNRDSGADNCRQTVFTVGERNDNHAH